MTTTPHATTAVTAATVSLRDFTAVTGVPTNDGDGALTGVDDGWPDRVGSSAATAVH